jgi:hypothetical protein
MSLRDLSKPSSVVEQFWKYIRDNDRGSSGITIGVHQG